MARMNYQAQQPFGVPQGAPTMMPQQPAPPGNPQTFTQTAHGAPVYGQQGPTPANPYPDPHQMQAAHFAPGQPQQQSPLAPSMPVNPHGSSSSLSSMNSPLAPMPAHVSGTVSPSTAPGLPSNAPPANAVPSNTSSVNSADYEHLRPKHSDRGWNDPPSQLFHGQVQAAVAGDKKKKRYVRPPTEAAHNLMYGGSGQTTPYGTTPQASPMSVHNAQFQPMPGSQGMPGQPMGPMGMAQGMPVQQGYGAPAPQAHAPFGGAQPQAAPGGYGMPSAYAQQQQQGPGVPGYGAPASAYGQMPSDQLHPQGAQSAAYGQYAGFPTSGVAPAQAQWAPR